MSHEPLPSKPLRALYELADVICSAIVLVAVLFSFFLRFAGVVGISMAPTLHNGQRLVITAFTSNPSHGDIVVVSEAGTQLSEVIVKRVVGLPGDVIDIDFDACTVSRNGEILNEAYINAPTELRGDVDFPIVVETGTVFLLGDNRNRSQDSRTSTVGQVDQRFIMGRVIYPRNSKL